MTIHPQLIGRVLPICSVVSLLLWVYGGRSPTALAQIRPDDFLGNTPSTVRIDSDAGQRLIEGGAVRGTTLFHSFKAFNIESDGNAYFANPDAIDLIVSRVTGRQASNLLGTLGVLGNADLFFINPNGITFGPNSALDLNGSFVASTADSLVFDDEFSFSANTPEAPSILTVNVPTGLQFGQQAGPIRYDAERSSLSQGLRLQFGDRSIALLGGELIFQGASLNAVRGRIDLGSVAEPGLVTVLPNRNGWAFEYGDIQVFDDLTADASFVNTTTEVGDNSLTARDQGDGVFIHARDIKLSGSTLILANTFTNIPAGAVVINARRLNLSESSNIAARAIALTEDDISGGSGSVVINASESITLDGAAETELAGFTTVTAISADVTGGFSPAPDFRFGDVSGNGGDIIINTEKLVITGGATITTSTNSIGNAGNITINATKLVNVSGLFIGEMSVVPSDIDSASTGGTGLGGSIDIQTERLFVQDAGSITAISEGDGDGGNINITANDMEVFGSVLTPELDSLASEEIPSEITTSASGAGNAGELLLNAERIVVRDGGRISTATFPGSSGNGNTLQVNATESIRVTRVSDVEQRPSGFFSSTEGSGNAGLLQIATPVLRVEEGGLISAATLSALESVDASNALSDSQRSIGRIVSGRAITPANSQASGGLDLQINRLILDDGALSVETLAQDGTGAEINISGLELLVLSNDSLLSAEAVNSANGGNIRLDASDGFVLAPVDTDSDILARANTGNGGEIGCLAQK